MSQPLRSVDRTTMLNHLGGWANGPGALYVRLGAAIAAVIERGDIAPGSRLPAERLLARDLSVSRGTVMAAYRQLRQDGWAESRRGSGTWTRLDVARPITHMNDDLAIRARRLTGRLLEQTQGVVDLTISAVSSVEDLPEELFVAPSLRALAGLADGHGYQPLGLPALRHRITAYYAQRSLPTWLDQVAVTNGAQQAISLVAGLLIRPGDAVVVESPTYPGAIDAFSRAGARLVSVPFSGDWPSTSVLKAAIAAHAPRVVYLMPACHNPIGRSMPESRRQEIAAIADQHDLYVVEDNILGDLTFTGRSIPPMAAFSKTGRVLTLGSLSKVAWGGLRIGWIRGPEPFIDRIGRLKAAVDLGSSPMTQAAACALMDNLDALAAHRRDLLERHAGILQDALGAALPDWSWRPPDGGLTLWVRLPVGDADAFNQHAIRHGVDFTPGSVHCADGSRLDHLRLAYGRPPDVLREGVSRLARAWTTYTAARDRVPASTVGLYAGCRAVAGV